MSPPAPPTPIPLPGDPRKVLIIKPSAVGDVVHALPVLNLVRRRWPRAHVAWLVTPACAGLLDRHPQLNDVILFDRKRLGGSWRSPAAFKELLAFGRSLRERNFDLVIDLQGLFRSGWLAHQTGAPRRVGFARAREAAWAFYTHQVAVHTPEQHALDRYLTVAEALGCGRGPVAFPFATDDADRRAVAPLLPGGGTKPYAVLVPGTNWATKRWPVQRFAQVAQAMNERFGLATVLTGAPSDAAVAQAILADANLVGRTTLRQLCAIIEGAALVVANDSGPMHIAAALGRPLVSVFGPTNPVRTGPYNRPDSVVRLDIPCSPCSSRACSHTSCLHWLGVEPVLEAAAAQLTPPFRPAARAL
ncbi:MAG TPA: lipopolysaccharide heptosyltransferase I [Tepidisphaeraceae bacterium]|nr:lipopolysaccharide heptosyltransferase I [Tepidisphaeraceae bacterium]